MVRPGGPRISPSRTGAEACPHPDRGLSAPRQGSVRTQTGACPHPDRGLSAPRQGSVRTQTGVWPRPDRGLSAPRQGSVRTQTGVCPHPDRGLAAPRHGSGRTQTRVWPRPSQSGRGWVARVSRYPCEIAFSVDAGVRLPLRDDRQCRRGYRTTPCDTTCRVITRPATAACGSAARGHRPLRPSATCPGGGLRCTPAAAA